MAVRGWRRRYSEILAEFGYSRRRDAESAMLLDSILGKTRAEARISDMVSGAPALVVGAGPSLPAALPAIRRARAVTIAAGSAAGALVRGGVIPDIVVTDLDGDLGPLWPIANKSVFVVHAHGDNAGRLGLARRFGTCMGTAQSGPRGHIADYGGFTDGDRAVFLARHHGASRIVLLGMDFGSRIGRCSCTPRSERHAKIKKLAKGRELLEWLATLAGPELYTTSGRIAGFERITYGKMGRVLE